MMFVLFKYISQCYNLLTRYFQTKLIFYESKYILLNEYRIKYKRKSVLKIQIYFLA